MRWSSLKITAMQVRNFKSFSSQELRLGDINVFIGGNASGKSNFVTILRFLRDVQEYGLQNAIAAQGGASNITNLAIGPSKPLELAIAYSHSEYPTFIKTISESTKRIVFLGIPMTNVRYRLRLKGSPKGVSPWKVSETIRIEGALNKYVIDIDQDEIKSPRIVKKNITVGSLTYSNKNGHFGAEPAFDNHDLAIQEKDLIPSYWLGKGRQSEPATRSLLEYGFLPLTPNLSRSIGIFDIDPKLPKKGIQFAGKLELEEDGSNLAIVLKDIAEDSEKKKRLYSLLQRLLPFFEEYDYEEFVDRSVLLKVREKHFPPSTYLYAPFVSDGTINIIALIVALFFERRDVVVIEEPERNVHPQLISRIVNLMKEAAQDRQIIVTTHNPELVKYVELDHLFLVSKDKNGCSRISKPSENEHIRAFLQNEIGVEELFVDNLLGG